MKDYCDCTEYESYKVPAKPMEKEIAHYIKQQLTFDSEYPVKLEDIECALICPSCGAIDDVITRYKPEHFIANQVDIREGICINPVQRYDFSKTAKGDRPQQEIDDWYGVAYIESYQPKPIDDSYQAFLSRMKSIKSSFRELLPTHEEWAKSEKEFQDKFLALYPLGENYSVLCLDGGAWDRPTWKSTVATIEEALAIAKQINGDDL